MRETDSSRDDDSDDVYGCPGPPKRTSTPARDDDDSDDDGASSQEVFQRLAGLVRGKKTGNADDPQPHRDEANADGEDDPEAKRLNLEEEEEEEEEEGLLLISIAETFNDDGSNRKAQQRSRACQRYRKARLF